MVCLTIACVWLTVNDCELLTPIREDVLNELWFNILFRVKLRICVFFLLVIYVWGVGRVYYVPHKFWVLGFWPCDTGKRSLALCVKESGIWVFHLLCMEGIIFCLVFGSSLSIVPGARYVDVFPCKSLQSRERGPLVARMGRLQWVVRYNECLRLGTWDRPRSFLLRNR